MTGATRKKRAMKKRARLKTGKMKRRLRRMTRKTNPWPMNPALQPVRPPPADLTLKAPRTRVADGQDDVISN